MPYVRGFEFQSSYHPGAKIGRYYSEQAKEKTTVGDEYWFDGRDLGLYSDLPYGQDRVRCKCENKYSNGALFSVKAKRRTYTFYLGWWEIWKTIR